MSEKPTGINAEFQQRPPQKEFNARIDQLINEPPFQSTKEKIILTRLQGYFNLPLVNTNDVSVLYLWDLAKQIHTLDQTETVSNKIMEHGQTIVNIALYLNQAIDDNTIVIGEKAAEVLITQLYEYGIKLMTTIDQNATPKVRKLSQQQILTIDHLLGIDKFFKTPTRTDTIENQRKQILSNFFSDVGRTAASLLEPISPYTEQITEAIEAAITMPAKELENSIIYQKMLFLSQWNRYYSEKDNKEYSVLYGKKAPVSLHRKLKIEQNRYKLESSRGNWPKEHIGMLEEQIAKKIQKKTISYVKSRKAIARGSEPKPDKKTHYNLGTALGAVLMEQAGIKCFIANTTDSSALLLMTADNRYILMDMTNSRRRHTHDVTSRLREVSPDHIGPEGLRIDNLISGKQNSNYTLYPTREGLRTLTFFDMAIDYLNTPLDKDKSITSQKSNNYQRSIMAFEKIISSGCQDDDVWYNYGETPMMYITDSNLTDKDVNKVIYAKKATTAFLHFIGLNSTNNDFNTSYTKIFEKTTSLDRADEAYEQARKLRPKRQKSAA